jgi:HEAT repeat protein
MPEDEAKGILDRLVELRVASFASRDAEITALLDRLAESSDPLALPRVAWFLSSEPRGSGWARLSLRRLRGGRTFSSSVTHAARRAASALLPHAPITALPRIEEAVRADLGWGAPDARWLVQSLSRSAGPHQEPPAALALASFHPCGYLREAAVRSLARLDDGMELPYLLLRLNDWVSEVRRVAEEEVLSRAGRGYARHFVACLPLVDRLRDLSRADQERVLEAITSVLQGSEARGHLVAAARDGEVALRRSALRALERSEATPWREVLAVAAADPDLVIRGWAAREAVARAAPEDARGMLERMAGDPHVSVRASALRGLVHLPGARPASHLRAALLDPAASVRGIARFHLRDLDADQDFAALYRAELHASGGRRRRAAASGLGETGTASDAAAIAPLLGSDSSRDVIAALRALHLLAPQEHRATLMSHLADRRPGVRSAAAKLLAPSVSADDVDGLLALLATEGPPADKLQILWSARRLDAWPQLRVVLALPAAEDDDLAAAGRSTLVAWCRDYDHTARPPRRAARAELEEVLHRLEQASAWTGVDVAARLGDILERESLALA